MTYTEARSFEISKLKNSLQNLQVLSFVIAWFFEHDTSVVKNMVDIFYMFNKIRLTAERYSIIRFYWKDAPMFNKLVTKKTFINKVRPFFMEQVHLT